ncbi:eukaryotic translation initiation factor 4E binding protein thor [Dermatophagoides farinae]|nr:eukaryotic translation initiation factor 4E-binding protein 3-like [Dermatophagoides farinae]XP_046916499.1 eukaryotic translation initiation factor 4E-binding protein 3-like [Dermatophagoides farinae]KAH7638331.1 eukaryotic translation initiation factor 4e-binding protein 1-like [Dermatophagoides farinae]KAH9530222.1 Eukaryotic translation initiation factor 4E binding protein (EIF4EBP), variant 2 [Dermatophagoides farinae]
MKEVGTKAIPASRRHIVNDPNELPDRYSSTPGGTLYSTTPGGTRIIYERNFLMNLKNSPLARSPPTMAFIPGVTNIEPTAHNPKYEALEPKNIKNSSKIVVKNHAKKHHHRDEQPQFDIDI